jgi:hypothetical protein
MHVIRNSAEMASLCQHLLDPEALSLIGPYAAALEEFGDDLAAVVLLVGETDTLDQAERVYGKRLVADGELDFEVELIEEHNKYIEIVHIASDDGTGLVCIVDKDGDPDLLAACRLALAVQRKID